MHEVVLSAQRQKQQAWCARAGHLQAADGLRLPSADQLFPADRAGGADDRADGDGKQADAG